VKAKVARQAQMKETKKDKDAAKVSEYRAFIDAYEKVQNHALLSLPLK
jgi:hypothetical protein